MKRSEGKWRKTKKRGAEQEDWRRVDQSDCRRVEQKERLRERISDQSDKSRAGWSKQSRLDLAAWT